MTAPMVREMQSGDEAAWDRFVRQATGGTFFHLSGWKQVFKKALRLKTCFLLAERGSEITAVLPMVHQRSWMFGHALIAAPFCVEGGPLAADAASLAAIDAAAKELMAREQASYIEYRSRRAMHTDWEIRKDLYATFARSISGDAEENLLSIPRKERAVVRKALEEGALVSEMANGTGRFFAMYSRSVRNLGTPVFPKHYFDTLREVFADNCDIMVVTHQKQPVSAVMNFYFKDTVLPYYGGGNSRNRVEGADSFMYWEVMRRAAERGYKRFDFGRSKANTGAFAFKKNWGFEPEWLEYEYCLSPGMAIPQKNPTNPKYRLFIRAWKCLPLPLANALGPLFIRNLG